MIPGEESRLIDASAQQFSTKSHQLETQRAPGKKNP